MSELDLYKAQINYHVKRAVHMMIKQAGPGKGLADAAKAFKHVVVKETPQSVARRAGSYKLKPKVIAAPGAESAPIKPPTSGIPATADEPITLPGTSPATPATPSGRFLDADAAKIIGISGLAASAPYLRPAGWWDDPRDSGNTPAQPQAAGTTGTKGTTGPASLGIGPGWSAGIGAGLGAGGGLLLNELFEDERDPNKDRNRLMNILLGAGLGAGGGYLTNEYLLPLLANGNKPAA